MGGGRIFLDDLGIATNSKILIGTMVVVEVRKGSCAEKTGLQVEMILFLILLQESLFWTLHMICLLAR